MADYRKMWEDPLNLCTNDNFHAVDSKGDSALSKTWYTQGCNTAYTKFMLMDWVVMQDETEISIKDIIEIIWKKNDDGY